jgi:hypothetical protein
VVVKRVPDTEGYEAFEPQLIERLPEVRSRLIEADLGEGNGRGDDLHSPGGAEAMAVGHSRCPKSLSPGARSREMQRQDKRAAADIDRICSF